MELIKLLLFTGLSLLACEIVASTDNNMESNNVKKVTYPRMKQRPGPSESSPNIEHTQSRKEQDSTEGFEASTAPDDVTKLNNVISEENSLEENNNGTEITTEVNQGEQRQWRRRFSKAKRLSQKRKGGYASKQQQNWRPLGKARRSNENAKPIIAPQHNVPKRVGKQRTRWSKEKRGPHKHDDGESCEELSVENRKEFMESVGKIELEGKRIAHQVMGLRRRLHMGKPNRDNQQD